MGRAARRRRRLPALPGGDPGRRRRVLPDPARAPRDGRRPGPLVRPVAPVLPPGLRLADRIELEQGLAAIWQPRRSRRGTGLECDPIAGWERRSATRCSRWIARSSATSRGSRRWSRPGARRSACPVTVAWSSGCRRPGADGGGRSRAGPRSTNGSLRAGRRPGGDRSATDRGLGVRDARSGVRRARTGALRSRGLVGGDIDVELDVPADEPAAGLEGDVPVQAPRLAVDLGRQVEAGVATAAHTRDDPVELGVERDGLRDVPDRDVGGDPVGVAHAARRG